jgi:glycine/D-amino acid oxidase-like deaminating enzyme
VELTILGAGIAGCALAHHLARLGTRPVAVFDPATPAAGATGRAAGVVTEQLWNEWDVAVARESKEEYAQLAGRWDPSAYRVNGFARFTRDPTAAQVLVDAVPRLRAWGVEVSALGPPELSDRIPWGRFDDVQGAIWSAGDAVVTPSAITEIYAEQARNAGVEFQLATPMHALARSSGAWELTSAGRTIRSDLLVVAAGAWSKRLFAGIGHALPLAPYRTQAAVLRPASPATPHFPSAHDIDLDVYVRPESNGRILAGDGTELVEVDPDRFRPGGDEPFVNHLAESFAVRFPGWADAELVRAWAGVCTSTPDRRPLVGAVDADEGLFAITGFNGFGVMRAGGAARRLAEAIAGHPEGPDAYPGLAPVRPSRFAGYTAPFAPRPGFTVEGGDAPRF